MSSSVMSSDAGTNIPAWTMYLPWLYAKEPFMPLNIFSIDLAYGSAPKITPLPKNLFWVAELGIGTNVSQASAAVMMADQSIFVDAIPNPNSESIR